MTSRTAGASFPALGTTAQIVTTRAEDLDPARAILERELSNIDRACSRFRDDSELTRVNAASGDWVVVSPLFLEALQVAMRAARLTGGIVVPTVGRALETLGYDRDFASIEDGPAIGIDEPRPASSWESIELGEHVNAVKVPAGVHLDFGATAKALTADRAARAAHEATGAGVLISLGGDIAVAGAPLEEGWHVRIADDHRDERARGPIVSITSGGLATSSTTVRTWHRGSEQVNHIIDPRTGRSPRAIWRTVSVAAGTCVDANIASTAAIVLGRRALSWLARIGLPARLVSADGAVFRVGGWPREEIAS